MNRAEIAVRVRETINTHIRVTPHAGWPNRGSTPVIDDSPLEELLIDDLDRLEVTMAIEEAFDVELDYEVVADALTVGHIIDHVASRVPALEALA